MISKAEATIMADQFTDTLRARVEEFLRRQALRGVVGGVFVYTTEDKGPKAAQVVTELQTQGWTVVLDTGARTATIS